MRLGSRPTLALPSAQTTDVRLVSSPVRKAEGLPDPFDHRDDYEHRRSYRGAEQKFQVQRDTRQERHIERGYRRDAYVERGS